MTIDDLARTVGVSRTTVSAVLSGKGRISETTRQRILRVMRERQYVPSANAQRLAKGQSKVIAHYD